MKQPAGRIRINGGSHRGRMIEVPSGNGSRPTGARVREALFNILTHMEPGIAGSTVLDACAGSGALGIEALSRGATHATFFETSRDALTLIAGSLRKLGMDDRATAKRSDACKPSPNQNTACNLVFLDPPYASDIAATAPGALTEAGWIGPKTLLIIETRRSAPIQPKSGFTKINCRAYGDSALYFLQMPPQT